MARVTVEDCLAKVPNRFALTILASRRARALLENRGVPQVQCDNKQAVVALREISAGNVRYVESVDQVMVDYIEEQRNKLRASNTDNTFLEAAAFGGIDDDDDGDDVGGDVEELTADLESLGTKNADNDDDDDDVDVNKAEDSDVDPDDDDDDETEALSELGDVDLDDDDDDSDDDDDDDDDN